jgi:small nuclear ribonucleoprotein (snRNP)-like protein
LASKLAKKYGTAVRLLLAESKSQASGSSASQPKHEHTDTKEHDEDWYNLRSSECGSGDLSFVSESFDPAAVLTASETHVMKVNPWVSDCPLLDTVGQFSFHLPKGDPLRRDPGTLKRPTPNKTLAPKKKQRQLHPFESIAQSFESGPLSVLHRFQRQRVRVITRYVNAIRGTLTGTLLAFDKHMNMILRDVVEVYSPRPLDSESKSNVETEIDRRRKVAGECKPETSKGWSVRQREMKQIMVRGDNVVAVYKAEEERKLSKSIYSRSAVKAPESKEKQKTNQADA